MVGAGCRARRGVVQWSSSGQSPTTARCTLYGGLGQRTELTVIRVAALQQRVSVPSNRTGGILGAAGSTWNVSTYRPAFGEIVACPRMHVLGVTAVPGRYSSWMVLNPLKCRVARLNINHSLYQPWSVSRFPPETRRGSQHSPGREGRGGGATWTIDRAKNLIGSPSAT